MMKKRNGIQMGLSAVCAACVMLAASCSQSPLENNVGFTAGRTSATVVAVAGLISSVIGGLSLRAAGRSGNGRAGAIIALALGLIGTVLSVVHLGNSTGGFGTGSGRAGAIAALVLGITGIVLGGLALYRSRRSRDAEF